MRTHAPVACRLFALAITALITLPVPESLAVDVTPLSLGSPAPDFQLPGVDGKDHRLSDFASAKVLVIIFTCNHCPTAQAYEDRIIQLQRDFQDKGVTLVAISPNDPQALRLDELGYTDLNDSLEDMKIRAKNRNFTFPYLYDGEKQQVSQAYGVLATPHVFIFDAARKLRYVGGIDDNDRGQPKNSYAREAIEDLVAGRPVARPESRAFGCSTKWSDKRASARESIEKWNQEPVTLRPIDEAGVRQLVANDTDKYRLINVWATWCIPCVEELPELVTINRMYRKRPFEVITISMDAPDDQEAVLKTLKGKYVATTNYLFTSDDREALADALDREWKGPVPYTLLVAPGGKVIYRKLNALEPLPLRRVIADQLGRTYK